MNFWNLFTCKGTYMTDWVGRVGVRVLRFLVWGWFGCVCGGGGLCMHDLRERETYWHVGKCERGVSRECVVEMSHVTHVNRSCHAYKCVMSRIWMSHVTHMNASGHAYECVRSRIWMRHVAHMTASCLMYQRVASHIWTSHVTNVNASCCTYKCAIAHMNVSWHTRGWVMSHIWLSLVKYQGDMCHI